MFKAFLKKVEESTEQLGASFKSKDNGPKTLDLIKKEITPVVKKLDIDVSLSSLKSQPQSPQSPPPTPIHYKEDLDLHPGATFLKKYQEKLGELHTNNVILAKKAEAVDRKLPTLVRHCTNHHEVWKRLHNEITRLPELSANISNIRNQIDVILVKFDEMEILLSTQVETYHANELTKYKDNLVNDGNKYQAQKQKELASLEEELVTTRAKYEREKAAKEREQARLQRLEEDKQRRLKEEEEARQRRLKEQEEAKQRKLKEEEETRQRKLKEQEEAKQRKLKEEEEAKQRKLADNEKKSKEEEEKKTQEKLRSAFGNAFQHQMDQFKKFGAVIVPKKNEPVPPVENLVPEENPQAIEDFLKDSSDAVKVAAESSTTSDASTSDVNEKQETVVEKETEVEAEHEDEKNILVKGDEEPETESKEAEKEEKEPEQKEDITTQEVAQETAKEEKEETTAQDVAQETTEETSAQEVAQEVTETTEAQETSTETSEA